MKSSNQGQSRPSVAHAVMEALVQVADGGEVCNPSLFELSQATGLSRRSVCRAIHDLTVGGTIVFSHRFAPDGRQLSNEYHFVDEERTGS